MNWNSLARSLRTVLICLLFSLCPASAHSTLSSSCFFFSSLCSAASSHTPTCELENKNQNTLMWLTEVWVCACHICSTLLLMGKQLHTVLVILTDIFPHPSPTLTTIHTLALLHECFLSIRGELIVKLPKMLPSLKIIGLAAVSISYKWLKEYAPLCDLTLNSICWTSEVAQLRRAGSQRNSPTYSVYEYGDLRPRRLKTFDASDAGTKTFLDDPTG